MIIVEYKMLRLVDNAATNEQVFRLRLNKSWLFFKNDEILVRISLSPHNFELQFTKLFVQTRIESATILASPVYVLDLTVQRSVGKYIEMVRALAQLVMDLVPQDPLERISDDYCLFFALR